MSKSCCHNEHSSQDHGRHHGAQVAATSSHDATAIDPVCGMTVNIATAKHVLRYGGLDVYFCSTGCREKFKADPEKYSMYRREPEEMPEGTLYTCPMHPEIVRDAPGTCPICGMALEPMGVPSADEGPNPELVDFRRRMYIGAALTLPLLFIAMGACRSGRGSESACPTGSNWRWQRLSSCGVHGHSSSDAGSPWSIAVPTCGP
jgi:YHS domain-containing protein